MKLAFLVSLAFGAVSFLPACSLDGNIAGIRMSNPETTQVYYGNFSYEGINVTVDYRNGMMEEIPLSEEMISEIERLKFFKIGEQKVEVVYRSRYKTTMPINVVLNQFKDTYALNGYECVYDGQPHMVTLNQELPEGATITYPYGNIFTNAGIYEVVGVISKNGYESKTLTTTLTIHQAERDVSAIAFEDATYVYNGEMRTIEAQNVPEGVTVSYEIFDTVHNIRINKAVNAGTYRFLAHFTDTSPNYAKIPDMEAKLTIEKAHYDLSDITFEDAVKEYDGLDYVAKITNADQLPVGITVSYAFYNEDGKKVTSNANVGTYSMVASFEGAVLDNYHPIEPMKATLTVSHRVIKISDRVFLEGKTVNFEEGVTHSLAISGSLPETVEVTYENNGQMYAGEYLVTAHFTAKSENEAVDLESLSAYLIINRVRRSVKVYNEATEAYDLNFAPSNLTIKDGVISVTGYDESVFRLVSADLYCLADNEIITKDFVVVSEPLVSGTTYKYVVVFAYLDENMNTSVILSEESDNITYIEE